jgi:hypothetical protein
MVVSGLLLVGVGCGGPVLMYLRVQWLEWTGMLHDEQTLAVWGAWYEVYRLPRRRSEGEVEIEAGCSGFVGSLCAPRTAPAEERGGEDAAAAASCGLVAALLRPESFESVLLAIRFMVVLAAALPSAEAQAGWLLAVFAIGAVITSAVRPYSDLVLPVCGMLLTDALNRMEVATFVVCFTNIAVAWSLGRRGPKAPCPPPPGASRCWQTPPLRWPIPASGGALHDVVVFVLIVLNLTMLTFKLGLWAMEVRYQKGGGGALCRPCRPMAPLSSGASVAAI